jgi:hypothetical protein
MVAVADRRFDDARALCATRENARANGAVYLAGFVIEILLKAQLVRKYDVVAKKRSHEVPEAEREIWDLIWRRHDMDGMLLKLRDLEASLQKRGERDGVNYLDDLKSCAQWSIFARYSTKTISMADADAFLDRVRRLRQVLR